MTSIELESCPADLQRPMARPSLAARLSTHLAAWNRKRAQRLALRDLVAFSPYLLDDLGITPGDIAAALEQRAFEARRRS